MKGERIIKERLKNILILLLIIILLSIMYSKFIRKDEIINVFGKSFFIVVTGSMEPTIKAGELIITSEEKNYKEGDIVTFKDSEDYIITHRIVEIDNGTFITKGDGNNIEDERNSIKSIKGKVIFHSKILGFFVIYFLKPLIMLYIIVFLILNIYKTYKSNEENKIVIKEGDQVDK